MKTDPSRDKRSVRSWGRTPWAGALVLALPLVLVAALTGLGFPIQTDEAKFHWDVVRQFGETWPAIPWRDYHAATPPLPYLLWAAWGKVWGYELPALRALTLIMTYAGVLAFYGLALRRGHPWPLAESLLLLFSPYVFLNSFTLYTVNMGLLFEVLALWYYLDEERLGWRGLLVGSLAATVAVCCRQHYLFLAAGMGLWWLVRTWNRRHNLHGGDVRDVVLIALPLLVTLPLFLAWGGFTPPAFRGLHPIRLSLEHVNFLCVFVGLYFMPLALVAWPAIYRWGRRSAWLLVGLPIYLLFRPYYERTTDEVASSEQGIILRGLDMAGGVTGPVAPALAQFVLWANGLGILAAGVIARRKAARDESLKLVSWVAAFAVVLTVSDFVGERFYALIVPVLLLLLYPLLYPMVGGRRLVCALWLAGAAGLAAVYVALKMQGG
jgi:hypothetical protein